jgi:hypothetical protein
MPPEPVSVFSTVFRQCLANLFEGPSEAPRQIFRVGQTAQDEHSIHQI